MASIRTTSSGMTIAAEFEDCMQSYQVLCSAIEANAAAWSEKTPTVRKYRMSLLQWGYRTGAATKALDYALHKSSELRDEVLELLEGLNACLQRTLNIVQMAAVPLLSPAALESPQVSYFDIRPDDRTGLGSWSVADGDLDPKIEEIHHVLTLLERLTPALRNPVPLDLLFSEANATGIEEEIALVTRLFPRASVLVARRLATANWQRRLFLRSLRARIQKERMAGHQMAMTPGSSRRLPLASPQALPSRQNQLQSKLLQHRTVLGKLNSRRTSFSDSTATHSAFWSKGDSVTAGTATSVAESEDHAKLGPASVPLLPVPLENGATFRCQYCGLEIVVGETCEDLRRQWLDHKDAARTETTKKVPETEVAIALPTTLEVLAHADWVAHVFADLEPYICTSTLCTSASKTYGSIVSWLKHELDVHRLPKVWICHLCNEKSANVDVFESHLVSAHQVSREQASMVSVFCEKFTDGPADLNCALCALRCGSIDSFRTHVAAHLEQLALCSIEADEKAEEEIPGSPMPEPASADIARLEDFVFSQTKYYPPQVFQEFMGEAARRQGSVQPLSGDGLRAHKASTSADSSKRPPMTGRGLSYNFFLDARKQTGREAPPEGMDPVATHFKASRTNPPPRNADFIGRISDMDNIHQQLSKPGTICVLSGIGGQGKSALAAEYTYRFEIEYTYIFWVQAETAMICSDTFAHIAISSSAKKGDSLSSFDEQRLVSLGQEFLEQTKDRWLLVFDNVDETLDLRRFLPSNMESSTGSVLITTNKKDIGLSGSSLPFTQINLGPLTLEESRCLLLAATPEGSQDVKSHPEYKLAGDIAKRAERLPLALSLIAGYMMVSHCTLVDFVDLWNERRRNIRASSKGPVSEADEALEALWDIGLREVTNDARKLLNILAFLDPDQIQKELLVGLHEDPVLELLHVSEAGRFRRMTSELKRRRLVGLESKNGEDMLSIHRKLQARILRDLDKDISSRKVVFTQAFLLVRSRFPSASPIQVPEPDKWPMCKKYLPHVLSLQRLLLGSLIHIEPSLELARLFSDGGIDLWERGLTTEGLDLLKSAEAILDRLNRADFQSLRADIHVIISLLLQDSGLIHIGECHDRIKTALEIRSRNHHNESGDLVELTRTEEFLLYNAWSDYACVLLQLNMFEEAKPIFEKCLVKYQEWGAPTDIPYEYSKGYHHSAFCLMYRGAADQAIENAERGVDFVEKATGRSAAYYRWKFDLACLLFQHPNFADSPSLQSRTIALHKEILEARLILHGKFTFLALESFYALGSVLSYLGDLSEAENCMRTILEIEKTRPGSCNELALARTQFHLSQLLLAMEEGSQASQHATSRSDAATTTASIVEQNQAKKLGAPFTDPTIEVLRPPASFSGPLAGSAPAQTQSTKATLSGVLPQANLTVPQATVDRRLQESNELARAANKILDKHMSQATGPFVQLKTGEQPEEAKKLVEDNPTILFDLMQPVFDGRFAGRDAMEYLRLIKGKAFEGAEAGVDMEEGNTLERVPTITQTRYY